MKTADKVIVLVGVALSAFFVMMALVYAGYTLAEWIRL